tara:strand:- start:335 stop:661 length:327 start_codon:yes stop_codon:yes gene_type:complete
VEQELLSVESLALVEILYFHLLLQRVVVAVVTTTQMQLPVVQVVVAHLEVGEVLHLVDQELRVKVMMAVMRQELIVLTVVQVAAGLVLLEAMVQPLTVEMVAMALQTQ